MSHKRWFEKGGAKITNYVIMLTSKEKYLVNYVIEGPKIKTPYLP